MNRGLATVIGAVVTAVIRHPLLVILLALLLAVISGRYAANHLGINTDTANMISPTLPWRQDFIEYRDAFPARDRNILIALEAADPDVAAEAALQLADALTRRPAEFERVFLAGSGEFFDRNGLLFLPLGDLESLSDRLVAAQPLIGRLRSDFSGAAILDLTRAVLTQSDATMVAASTADPLLATVARTLTASAAGESLPMHWRELIGGPDIGETRQLLLVGPVLDFNRVQPAQAAIEAIREEIQILAADAEITVRLSGTVAMEHEELVSVTRGASAAGIAALIMVVGVLLWALRSVVLLALSLVTLLTGLVFTAAFAAVTVGHLNLISVAFAVLYVGLGVDFILHMCLRLQELVAAGHDRHAALVETASGVGVSLVICAVTTAAGFFAFIPTQFDGVSELGLISGGGMFISLIVSLTLLPALLAVAWRPRIPAAARASAQVATARSPRPGRQRFARVTIAIALILTVAATVSLPALRFDSNPIHLRDPESESIRLLNELAATSEAPLFSMAAIANDPDEALRWREAMTGEPTVARVITPESLVPAEQQEKIFVLEDLAFVLGDGFADLEAAPFEAGALLQALSALRQLRPSGQDAAGRLQVAVEQWFEARAGLDAASVEARLRQLDSDLRSDLRRQLQRLALRLEAEPFGIGDLPESLRERWVDAAGRELVEFVPAEDLNDNDAAARFVAAVREVAPRATGLPLVYQEASRTIVRAFTQALSFALIMVAVLLLLMLRRIAETVLVLLPILFAAVTTAGLAVLFDLPFNFANIIALPLLIGVGVDNGIHIVHRMRTEPPEGGGPFATSTSRAVLASGLTTIASFGNLAFSAHLGMASMGQLLTIGMLVTLAATLILLPAMLSMRKAA